jgi:hypothetical protein
MFAWRKTKWMKTRVDIDSKSASLKPDRETEKLIKALRGLYKVPDSLTALANVITSGTNEPKAES